MEVIIAVQNDTLLSALRLLLKRIVSARRGGGNYEIFGSGPLAPKRRNLKANRQKYEAKQLIHQETGLH